MKMNTSNLNSFSIENLSQLASQLPTKIPCLKMLVLFGSRARGDIHINSDWDFAILYDNENAIENEYQYLEVYKILSDTFPITNEIDLVDLANCSSLIAHSIARDGKVLYEKESGLFASFQKKVLLSENQLKIIQQNLRRRLESFLVKRGA